VFSKIAARGCTFFKYSTTKGNAMNLSCIWGGLLVKSFPRMVLNAWQLNPAKNTSGRVDAGVHTVWHCAHGLAV
jgi:hypothetical protein